MLPALSPATPGAAGMDRSQLVERRERPDQVPNRQKPLDQVVNDVTTGALNDLFGKDNIAGFQMNFTAARVTVAAAAMVQQGPDYGAAYAAYQGTAIEAEGVVTLKDGRSFEVSLSYLQEIQAAGQESGRVQQGPPPPPPGLDLPQGEPTRSFDLSMAGLSMSAPPPPKIPDQIAATMSAMKKLLEMLNDSDRGDKPTNRWSTAA